jgi:hypothetical protein
MHKNSSTKQKPKVSRRVQSPRDRLQDIFSNFEKISREEIPLQAKVDRLNLEMLRILRERIN